MFSGIREMITPDHHGSGNGADPVSRPSSWWARNSCAGAATGFGASGISPMSGPDATGGIARRARIPFRLAVLIFAVTMALLPSASLAQDTSPAATAERQIVDLNAELEGRHQGSAASGTDRPDTGRAALRQRTDSRQGAPGSGLATGSHRRTSTRGSISSDRRLPPVRPRPPRLPVNARRWIALARDSAPRKDN